MRTKPRRHCPGVEFGPWREGERGKDGRVEEGECPLFFGVVVTTYTRASVQLLLHSLAIRRWGSLVERWLLRRNMGIVAESGRIVKAAEENDWRRRWAIGKSPFGSGVGLSGGSVAGGVKGRTPTGRRAHTGEPDALVLLPWVGRKVKWTRRQLCSTSRRWMYVRCMY